MDGTEFAVPTMPYVPPAVVNLVADGLWHPDGWLEIPGVEKAAGVTLTRSGELAVVSRDTLTFMSTDGPVIRTVEIDARDPVDIVSTSSGHLVVLERESNSLIMFDPAGEEVRRMPGSIASAGGLGVRDNRVYVSSPAGGVVYAFDAPDGTPVSIGITDAPPEEKAAQPSDVAVATDGTLFLADFERRVVVSGTEGRVERTLPGASGTGDYLPRIATYGEFVIVAEPIAERILILDREGKQRGVFVFPPEREGVRPTGMFATPDGMLYVVDFEHGRLYRFTISVPEEPAPVEPTTAEPSPQQ
jgi:streptogramin lyase